MFNTKAIYEQMSVVIFLYLLQTTYEESGFDQQTFLNLFSPVN